MRSVIHVNRHLIAKNKLTGSDDPVVTVTTYLGTTRAHEVALLGPSKLVYRPEKPLKCGATLWMETEAAVQVVR